MKIRAAWLVAFLVAAFSGRAEAQTPEEQRAEIAAYDENLVLAQRYIGHYLSKQYDAMVAMMADDIRVEDPAWPFEIEGREAVAEWLPDAYGGVDFNGVQSIMAYASMNGMVVVVSQVQAAWGPPGQEKTEFDTPMTNVLRIVDGKVVLQQDFPGYGCTTRQGLAQQEGRDLAELSRCGQLTRPAQGGR